MTPAERLPRADGDGPCTCVESVVVLEAPPCRRGWTRPAQFGLVLNSGSPVQTGMDPKPTSPDTALTPLATVLNPHHRHRQGPIRVFSTTILTPPMSVSRGRLTACGLVRSTCGQALTGSGCAVRLFLHLRR